MTAGYCQGSSLPPVQGSTLNQSQLPGPCAGEDEERPPMAKLNQISCREGYQEPHPQELTEPPRAPEAAAARRPVRTYPAQGRGGRTLPPGGDPGSRSAPTSCSSAPGRSSPGCSRSPRPRTSPTAGPRRRWWDARSDEGVPATYLLFLEKQLVDIPHLVEEAPELDASETWVETRPGPVGDRAGAHRQDQEGPSQPRQGRGHREAPRPGRGVLRGIVVGYWKTVKFSGALPPAGPGHSRAGGEAPAGAEVRSRGEANTPRSTS